ncbi:hypothetical protein [Sphingomonas sp. CLY1604]|uniref:hypothetical protein n=1 Tax=Sphingomonas sp. CLY1604 TaxID=3457786 RepID=UPI003FD71F88
MTRGESSSIEPLLKVRYSLNRGGTFVSAGAMAEDAPISLVGAMSDNIRFLSLSWLMIAKSQKMADMVAMGRSDLSFF